MGITASGWGAKPQEWDHVKTRRRQRNKTKNKLGRDKTGIITQ